MTKSCFHCGQSIPSDEVVHYTIQNSPESFCCHGCAGVCDAIYEAGMQSFYRRTPDGELLSPPPPPTKDIEFFDYDEVQSQYVENLTPLREITLVSEAIHCAACIWLIEHTLAKIDGVKMAKVNFTNKQIKIRWDNDQIQLSDIIKSLNRVGYDAVPYDSSVSDEAFRKANRDLLYRLGFAGFAMMNVMWFSVALYTGADQDADFRQYFHWIEFIIATMTLLYSGKPFLQGALTSLKSRTVGMDVSISLGILVTYFYSIWVTVEPTHSGNAYYDTMIDFMFLLLIGRYLETISKNKAIDSSRRLMDLQPKVARLQTANGIEVVPVRKLQPGQTVLVKPGDQIPVDGILLKGAGNVNESMLSGESREIYKQAGSPVSAGTLNLDGALSVEVRSILQNTALGRIIHMVEDAQGSKAPIQCTAERIMPWFVSTVIALSLLTFSYWMIQLDFETAMIAATAVLIITCPCAFGLATPMATAVATGVSAQNGILIKNGAVLEILNEIEHFVFDKTGTLTKGQMQLMGLHFVQGQEDKDLIEAISQIEQQSEHSVAKAIVTGLQMRYPHLKNLHQAPKLFQAHSGKGVEAKQGQSHYLIGTSQWLKGYGISLPETLVQQEVAQGRLGQTSVWVARDRQIVAILFLEDEIREDAAETIFRLKQRGKKVSILSGDRTEVAETVAQRLGGMEVMAEVLPEQKFAMIDALKKTGVKVAMIGDGINDAPAMARADVSFALGSGNDVSMDCADLVLINNELRSVDTAVELSHRTLKTIKQNIASSILYNLTMVPLAMAAMLTPLIAAITMPLSSLIVIGNAARIRTFFSPKAIERRRQIIHQVSQ